MYNLLRLYGGCIHSYHRLVFDKVCTISSATAFDFSIKLLMAPIHILLDFFKYFSDCTSLDLLANVLISVLTYRHELGMNYNFIRQDLIVGSCLQVTLLSSLGFNV